MEIPSITECHALMERYGMLANIRRHSQTVAAAAIALVDSLENGPDRDLVIAGALLHDIAKTPCLDSGCDHAACGAEICLTHNLIDVAPIVAQHVILDDFAPQRYTQGTFTASEIVYYADKRVRHEEIVNLDERLAYILEHYGRGDPWLHKRIKENFNLCRELESYIFSFLDFVPADLPQRAPVASLTETLP